MLSTVIGIQHKNTLVWPFYAGCIPFLIPGMPQPIIEGLDRSVRTKPETVNKEIALD